MRTRRATRLTECGHRVGTQYKCGVIAKSGRRIAERGPSQLHRRHGNDGIANRGTTPTFGNSAGRKPGCARWNAASLGWDRWHGFV